MMRHLGITMEVECKTQEVLEKLRSNLTTHKIIVQEARDGYIEKAKQVLEDKLGKLKDGKLIGLSINLAAPQDHSDAYETVIHMLESHTEETITLDASTYRMMMEDKWDWMDNFLVTNSAYSKTAEGFIK